MNFLMYIALWASSLRLAYAVASYDEYRDADIQQTGYLPNHNMDPNIVDSSAFGQLWKQGFQPLEQFYAKPLTYTPLSGGNQLLFLASSQNYIRTLDAKTGVLINSRQVHTPFLQSDIGCNDIPNSIGITGTPTIDPATDVVYFFSKTYIPNYRVAGATGVSNGVYYFHGVNINTLADVFTPILVDGSNADNAPAKYFVGGVILQRPSLTQIGNVVYGAFGGHCDQYNYTGVVIGVDVVQAKIVTQWAVESGPLAPQTNQLLVGGAGGEGGIWMSGMGLASDGQRMFFVTGNGAAHQNVGAPATGTSGCQTLGEAAVNLAIADDGKLSVQDYFQPYDYQNMMDAGDLDYGAGALVLLNSTIFSGGGVNKIAITAGKNGKIYVLNANNLGGYKLGPGQTDGVLQTIATGQPVFGAAASYPGEGGYIYITPNGFATSVYQMVISSTGVPQFSQVGKSNELSAGRVGVGVPTVTSLNGQIGSGILWMTDPDVGLRAWYAVPQNGILQTIPMPQISGANKFQRPAFGDGRVYVTDSNGILYCLGSPVSLPLNCTSPVNFGNLAIGAKATQIVSCTANVAITKIVGFEFGSGMFIASNASLPTGALVKGQTFTFPVTWDLTSAPTDGSSLVPGAKSTPLTMLTNNAVTGFATSFPISLSGTIISQAPFLSVSPITLDYAGVVILDPKNIPTQDGIITISNKGSTPLTISGYSYTTDNLVKNPSYTNSTVIGGRWVMGYGFSAATLPAIGTTIAPNGAISIDTIFDPLNGTGQYMSYWQVWSNGGSTNVILEGAASTAPIANFSIANGEGGWLPETTLLMDFGRVTPGSTSSRQIRICNQGGSTLLISKSKPPAGIFRISDPTELEETLQITPGACSYGEVLMVANTEEYNLPDLTITNSWTLNTNDLTFGVHIVNITGTIVSTKVGPLNSTGATVYQYLGCFQEAQVGPRLFTNEPLSPSQTMSNANCQTACYGAAKYWFAGSEFADECYCGNTPPPLASQDLTDTMCNMACPGDKADRCGGTGYLSVFYDPTKYTAGADPSLYGPQTVKSVGSYSYQGCYSEATTGRALAGSTPQTPVTGFTIESCVAACQGFTYAGMEFANQCYCGNTIQAGSINQTSSVPATNGCNMICSGNSLEYCGGASRLSMYKLGAAPPASAPSSSKVLVISTTLKPTTPPTTTSQQVSTPSVSSSTKASSLATSLATTKLSSSSSITRSTSTSSLPSSSKSSSLASTSSTSTPSGPTTVTNLAGWNYLGCYTESTTGRALNGLLLPIAAAQSNVENCSKACAGYTYFGVEYGQECYCGNVINVGSTNTGSTINGGCTIVCTDNQLEYCGGRSVLNMYQAAPLVSMSSTSARATPSLSISVSKSTSSQSSTSRSSLIPLSTSPPSKLNLPSTSSSVSSFTGSTAIPSNSKSSSSLLSISSKVSTTSSSSHSSSLSSLSTISSSHTTSTTSVSASKTSNINLGFGISNSPTSTLRTSTTSSQSSSSASNAPLASFTGTPSVGLMIASQRYLGCYTEVNGRTLPGSSYTSAGMTIESCLSFCATNNYPLAGLEYSSQCYCGNTLTAGTALQVGSTGVTGCNMACSGASIEVCGGANRLSVFNNTGYINPSSPAVVNSFIFRGCYAEATNGRLLSGPSTTNPQMTVEICVNYCVSQGASWAGVEFGDECYCGSGLPTTAVAKPGSSCNMLCAGNNKEYCGAGGMLDIYALDTGGIAGRSAKFKS